MKSLLGSFALKLLGEAFLPLTEFLSKIGAVLNILNVYGSALLDNSSQFFSKIFIKMAASSPRA